MEALILEPIHNGHVRSLYRGDRYEFRTRSVTAAGGRMSLGKYFVEGLTAGAEKEPSGPS